MTKETLTHAIIDACNQSFKEKDPVTKSYKIIRDMHHMYSDILCLVNRFEKALILEITPKKKRKKSNLESVRDSYKFLRNKE